MVQLLLVTPMGLVLLIATLHIRHGYKVHVGIRHRLHFACQINPSILHTTLFSKEISCKHLTTKLGLQRVTIVRYNRLPVHVD